MAMLTRKIHNLRHFGLRHLVSVNAAYSDALMVDVQHNPRRFFPPLAEELLEYVNHELHRRVIVVEKQHLVKMWSLGLGACFGDETRAPFLVAALVWALIRASSKCH